MRPAGGGLGVARVGSGWRCCGVAAALAVIGGGAGGCSCETDFRLLQGEIESCFEAEWRCCQRIGESDPPAGAACFDELRQRRRRLSEMLFAWLEACRHSEADVARDLGRTIRGLLLAGTCDAGPVRTLGDGRTVTAGLPFGGLDSISLRWELPRIAPGGRSEATLSGRSIPVRIGDREAMVLASGRLALRLDPSGRAGPSVEEFELGLAIGSDAIGGPSVPRTTLRLARDPRFPATSVVRHGVERLGFLVEVVDGRDPWPLPRFLWMEWPVARQGRTMVVGGDSMRLRELIPPDPGIADWNGDARVDAIDLAEFLATPGTRRDLDLDGEDTSKDLERFLEAWRDRCEMPAR